MNLILMEQSMWPLLCKFAYQRMARSKQSSMATCTYAELLMYLESHANSLVSLSIVFSPVRSIKPQRGAK